MHYVYILELSNKHYYVGSIADLRVRLKEHQEGKVKSTKDYLPVPLIFYSALNNKTRALKFEKYLKTGSGFAFRNKHLV